MNVFRAALIVALVALFFAVEAVSAQTADKDHIRPMPSRYRNNDYKFEFYTLKIGEMYNKTGMEALLGRTDFRRYGATVTLGFAQQDLDENRALFFGEIKRDSRADIGRFERLRCLGVVFGPLEDIENRYRAISGKTVNGAEGTVYDSYVEAFRSVTVDDGKPDDDFFGDDPMSGPTKTTYVIRLRVYFVLLPDDKAVMLTFGARSEEADTYFKAAQAWFDDDRLTVKWPKEDNTGVYQNARFGLSFKIDKAWKEMGASEIKPMIDASKIFFGFASPGDFEDGRVILLTPGEPLDMRQNFWAAPSLMIVIHDDGLFVDEAFRISRESKISNEVSTYMRRTGNIVSQIEEIKGINVCRVNVAGESNPAKDSNGNTIREKEKITQVFYYVPMGAKSATFMFSFPASAEYSQNDIDALARTVCNDLEGLGVKKVETNTSYYLFVIAALIAGVLLFFFFRIRARIRRMQTRLGKRTYEHAGFNPKDLSLKPQKPVGPPSSPGKKKPPQG